MYWCCVPCGVIWSPLTWDDPEQHPAPECGNGHCRKPCTLHQRCPHCEGTGWVEATQWAPPNDGPCGECRGTGVMS